MKPARLGRFHFAPCTWNGLSCATGGLVRIVGLAMAGGVNFASTGGVGKINWILLLFMNCKVLKTEHRYRLMKEENCD